MHQNLGNLQRAVHKSMAIWLPGQTNAQETATNHHKRRFFVFCLPLRVPDSVWPACPRETLLAMTVACVPWRVDAWLFPPNGKSHTITSRKQCRKNLRAGAKRNPVKLAGSDEKAPALPIFREIARQKLTIQSRLVKTILALI